MLTTPPDVRLNAKAWLYAPLVVVALMGLAACNQAPPAPGISISPPDPTTTDDLIVSVSTTPDPNDDVVTISFEWTVDGGVRTDLTTDTVLAAETSKGEIWQVSVTPNDGKEDGEVAVQSVTIGNTVPVAEVDVEPLAPTSDMDIVATATATDIDGDAVTFSYTWTVDGADSDVTGDTVAASETTRGEVWEVTATPNDGDDDGAPVTAAVSVGNVAPVIADVTISPDPATTVNALVATATVTDSNGDTPILTYEWFVNSTAVQTGFDDFLQASAFDRGDEIIVTVTADDGLVISGPEPSAALIISNALPVVGSATIEPGEAWVDTTLTCVPTGWSDADADLAGYTWSWAVDGVTVTGADTDALTGADFAHGDAVTCTATPFDGLDSGAPTTSGPITIANTAPAVSGASLDTAAPTTTTAIGVVPGQATDIDGDLVAFSVEWFVDGESVATGEVLDPALTSKGQTVRAVVTPTDGIDDGDSVTTDSVVVINTLPVLPSLEITPDPALTTDLLIAVGEATDADGDAVQLTYRWTIDGLEVQSGSEPSLHAELFVRGEEIGVAALPNDLEQDGEPTAALSVVIGNTAPSVAGVTIEPERVTEASGADCVPDGWADADEDEPNYHFGWTVNGTPVSTESHLTSDLFAHGDTLVCAATPNDGIDDGQLVASASVNVDNTAPTVAWASVVPASPSQIDPPSLDVAVPHDDDEDPVTLLTEWFVDGLLVSTDFTLAPLHFEKGQAIHVRVTPNDGIVDGEAVLSDTVVAVNTPPEVDSVTLSADSLQTLDDITVSATASDIDAVDTPILSYAWHVNDVEVQVGPEVTLGFENFVRGDAVRVDVTASDVEADSEVVSSDTIVVENTAPTAPVVRTSPSHPRAGAEGTLCEVFQESYDPDEDAVTYVFSWTLDGAAYPPSPAAPDPTTTYWPDDGIPSTATQPGQQWECTVEPFDLFSAGPTASATAEPVDYFLHGIEAGTDYVCGLDDADEVRCWGTNESGQAAPPAGSFLSVSAGYFGTSCGIDSTNTIRCWGSSVVPPTGAWAQVASGLFWNCAVDLAGTGECFGTATQQPPAVPFREIAVGVLHACGLTTTNEIECWGDNSGGGADVPDDLYQAVAAGNDYACGINMSDELVCWGSIEAPPAGSYTALDGGLVSACALATDGSIACWGDPDEGRLDAPEGSYAEIAVGQSVSCAVDTSGELVCWGSTESFAVRPPTGGFDDLGVGDAHVCAIDDSLALTCWGEGSEALAASAPDVGGSAEKVKSGNGYSCVTNSTGHLLCWGDDTYGQVSAAPGGIWNDFDTGSRHVCGVDDTGTLACWGDDNFGQATPPGGSTWATVSAGRNHSCAVAVGGGVACWGLNSSNESNTPAGSFSQVSVAGNHSCGLLTSGAISCWGNDGVGQASGPLGVDYLAVSVGDQHSCALVDDGSVTCWGSNVSGKLEAPDGVYVSIDAGQDFTCAINDADETRCWGLFTR